MALSIDEGTNNRIEERTPTSVTDYNVARDEIRERIISLSLAPGSVINEAELMEELGLGYLPQSIGLFPHLTVRENIRYSPRARGLSPGSYQPLVDMLVEATGIGELLGRLPQTLSGGERQRVGLVRALASRPRLVLLDEPFASLNESLRQEIWRLLRELQRRQRLTVLLVTHNLMEAYFLAGRISILMDGRIRQTGDRASVYRRPATESIARFLGINNLWEGVVKGRQGDWLTVECPAAGILASLPAGEEDPTPRTRVMVGILPEHVAFRDAAHPPRPPPTISTSALTDRPGAICPDRGSAAETSAGYQQAAADKPQASRNWRRFIGWNPQGEGEGWKDGRIAEVRRIGVLNRLVQPMRPCVRWAALPL